MSTAPVSSKSALEPKQLLDALKPWVKRLVDDLRMRADAEATVGDQLRAEYDAEFKAGRTGEAYGAWLEGALTQAAVAWILATVFVRFLEDNQFVEPRLSGPDDRREQAMEHETAFYAQQRTGSVTDYLLATFEGLRRHQATALLFDEAHVPLWRLRISGDAARDLLAYWRKQNPDTGALTFDFTSEVLDTRFLGDLYQDLSEYARKKFALLQTPVFVEEFILDRTLEPAIETFGLEEVRMIDPTCGSGHFLLGGFERLLDKWRRQEPGTNPAVLVRRALDGVYGVDINPYAVAVARFRLLVAALREAGIHRLADELDLPLNIGVGDTLLCAPERQNSLFGQITQREVLRLPGLTDYEDAELLTRIFGQRYHAVVGNPPYITVKDRVLNEAYRSRFPDSCHKLYSLGVPFTEVFFRLAAPGTKEIGAGYVGMITADSFMKREFGRKLIETVLPRVDLTHIISASGAYIPGHGTPTVILLGRNSPPTTSLVRVVMAIQGEPSTPANPANGLVWTAIINQLDIAGSESQFVSVADVARDTLNRHPWSIGGGGAAELKEAIEAAAISPLSKIIEEIGFFGMSHGDEVFTFQTDVANRHRLETALVRPIISGDGVRDFMAVADNSSIFPYIDGHLVTVSNFKYTYQWLWPYRTTLGNRATFGGGTYYSEAKAWWSWHQVAHSRIQTPLSIIWGEISTHNHFVLERGGKVFKQTAPVIKLPAGSSEEDHLKLLGLLNSSTACFWLQQVCHNKGGPGGGSSKDEKWHDFYQYNGTKVAQFPLASDPPLEISAELDCLSQSIAEEIPSALLQTALPTQQQLLSAKESYIRTTRRLVALQEELDWACYHAYKLSDKRLVTAHPPEIAPGERAFEVLLARAVQAGDLTTKWFDWLKIEPKTVLPAHWSMEYRDLVEARILEISSNPNVALIEKTNYKRRWESESWGHLEKSALRNWILRRLESAYYWSGEPTLRSTRNLATIAARDADLVRAVELYTGQAGAELHTAISSLVAVEAVPFLPVHRYSEDGIRKRAAWEDTWTWQRRQDIGEDVTPIPAPPKYKSDDFQSKDHWRLRGPMDVPKERFISYPGIEKLPDDSLVVGWAGWNHLEQATALTSFYDWASRSQGWSVDRLIPLLAGIDELLPWLRQWHGEIDPATGTRPFEDFEAFLDEELRMAGLTQADLRAWTPPVVAKKRGRKSQA